MSFEELACGKCFELNCDVTMFLCAQVTLLQLEHFFFLKCTVLKLAHNILFTVRVYMFELPQVHEILLATQPLFSSCGFAGTTRNLLMGKDTFYDTILAHF